MGKAGTHASDEAVVIPVDGHGEATGEVVLKLHRVGHRFTGLPHISQGAGEQVGVAFVPESKNHRGAYIEGVTVAMEAAPRATGNQISL